MPIRKRVVCGLLIGFLLLISAGGASRGTRAGGPFPPNVHPAVIRQIQAAPGDRVRVIVSKGQGVEGVEQAAAEIGADITARWTIIDAFAAELPGNRVAALARLPGVKAVLSNSPVARTSNGSSGAGQSDPALPYVMAVKAHHMWNDGFTGTGMTVAVVDSGIIQGEAGPTDFGSRVLAQVAVNPNTTTPADGYGHGTHVAAIIGGDGQNSGGSYKGVAPGVNLVSVKFGDDQGNATEEELINALQWVYDHRESYNIRVANISALVANAVSYTESPTDAAVEQLWLSGVVVVVAAGNYGTDPCAVCYPPANDPYVISVGAIDDNNTAILSDDFMKEWSSRGTTQDGFVKPDLVAPGARIVAYMPAGLLREVRPENVVDTHYFHMGGTSMSAPVVSGVVALLLQARPELSPDQVKWLLQATARSYESQPEGTPGIVDAHGAYEYKKTVESANQGLTPSPLLDPSTGTIDYSNTLWGNTLWGNTLWGHTFEY
ncbi:MAG: S8 family peptidase [Bacillota bacterium]